MNPTPEFHQTVQPSLDSTLFEIPCFTVLPDSASKKGPDSKNPSTVEPELWEVKMPQNQPVVGQFFKNLLFFLNFVGAMPVSYIKSKGEFGCHIFSFRFCWSACIAMWIIFVWVQYFFVSYLKKPLVPTTLGKPGDELEDSIKNDKDLGPVTIVSILWCIKVENIVWPMTQIVNTVNNWRNSGLLTEFLNKWSVFDADFSQAFPHGVDDQSEINFYSSKAFPLRIPAHWVLSAYFLMPLCTTLPGMLFHSPPNSSVFDIVVALTCSIDLGALDLMDDVKNVLMFRCCRDAFIKLKLGIQNAAEDSSQDLDSDQVQQWRNLVVMTRSQCELLIKYQRHNELLFLVNFIILSTASLFLLLNIPWGKGQSSALGVLFLCMCIIVLLRIYVKVSSAEAITREEEEIGKILSVIHIKEKDIATLVQVKLIHDLILVNPCEISFGKYIHYDKGILLSVFNQVITYLIVMMQFTQGK